MFRIALLLVFNWVACCMAVLMTGRGDPWQAFAIVDFITAMAMLRRPAGKINAILAATYLIQISWHFGYGLAGNAAAMGHYLDLLDDVAYAQLALMGAWVLGNGGMAYRLHRHDRADRLRHS